jgi:hypothetical protein
MPEVAHDFREVLPSVGDQPLDPLPRSPTPAAPAVRLRDGDPTPVLYLTWPTEADPCVATRCAALALLGGPAGRP